MNRLALSCALALTVTLASCNKEEEQDAAAVPPPPPKPTEFVAPSNGLLKPEQAARWRQADSLVRLLDSVYADSIRNNPDQTSTLLAQQDDARDRASRKAGLLGWKEYRWVLEEAPRQPANAAAFQAAGLAMPTPTAP
jgi:hypothetical protein